MKIYVDITDHASLSELKYYKMIEGLTFNKYSMRNPDEALEKVIENLGELISLPICVELVDKGAAELVEEAKKLAKKIPMLVIGLGMGEEAEEAEEAAYQLQGLGIKTVMMGVNNRTSAMEAVLAGATYLAPHSYWQDSLGALAELRQLVDQYGVHVGLMTPTIRNISQVEKAKEIGADIVVINTEKLIPHL